MSKSNWRSKLKAMNNLFIYRVISPVRAYLEEVFGEFGMKLAPVFIRVKK